MASRRLLVSVRLAKVAHGWNIVEWALGTRAHQYSRFDGVEREQGPPAPGTLLGPEGSGPGVFNSRVRLRSAAAPLHQGGAMHRWAAPRVERLPTSSSAGVRGDYEWRCCPYLENCTVDASIQ
jgi:hypothetical protein